jgi:acyl-CoA thioesterase FadM
MNRKALGQTGTGLESGSIGRYRVQQRVRWSDIDASGIILWSAYTRLVDLLDIEIWIGRIGRSSIRFELAMKKADGQLAAEGYLVIVAISRSDGKSVAVPERLAKALEPYTVAGKS